MRVKEPQDLLLEELRDIQSAEKQLQRALPRMSKQVESEEFQSLLEERQDQSQRLIEQIDQAFEQLSASKGRKKNQAAEGLLEEANEVMEQIEEPMLRDAALVGAVQKLTHYCLAAWGTSRAMAEAFGQDQIAQAMQKAVEEGKQHDQRMTELAEQQLYPAILKGDTEGAEPRSRGSRAGSKSRSSEESSSREGRQQTSSGGGQQGGGRR